MTKQERIDKANALRAQGYNCAQAVLMCFEDATGVPDAAAASLTSALGSGVAATGEICGVANAMAIAVGATYGPEPSHKAAASKEAREVVNAFACDNGGCLRCVELKGLRRTCNALVAQGVEMLHDHFAARAEKNSPAE